MTRLESLPEKSTRLRLCSLHHRFVLHSEVLPVNHCISFQIMNVSGEDLLPLRLPLLQRPSEAAGGGTVAVSLLCETISLIEFVFVCFGAYTLTRSPICVHMKIVPSHRVT